MIEVLFQFAAVVASAAEGLPDWAKYVLGPTGALVLLAIYAYVTEKKRIPSLIKQLLEAQHKIELVRIDGKEEVSALRTKTEKRETQLETTITEWRDKHTKERTVRAWWQSKAEDAYQQLDKEVGIPPDIDKTYFGGSSL